MDPKTPITDPKTEKEPPSTEPKKDDKTSALNAKPEGAPEKYEAFKVPDGFKLDEAIATEASALFKGLNLTQDQAQSLMDFHAKQITSANEAPYQAVATLKQTWESQLKTAYGKDIEPGGKVITGISKMIDALPDNMGPSFREAMDLTLAGSNPAFVKVMNYFAEKLGEGTAVRGNGPSPLGQKGPDAKPLSIAQAMYPNLPSANKSS